jgi:hypothetical protein
VVRGRRALTIVQNYIRLNELEETGKLPYRKERLRGVTEDEWQRLWS